MKNTMQYKDFLGTVEYSSDDDCLYGKIIGIKDLISYEGKTVEEIKADFENAVDEYLATCRELGKEPQRSYRGTFNIRITPELHKQATIFAQTHNMTLNSFVEKAIEHEINNVGG